MSEGLSRRELVSVLGAGAVISACSSETGNSTENALNTLDLTTCSNFGKNAHTKPKGENYPSEFACKFIAVLCIGLGKNWAMSVNHANFALKEDEQHEAGRATKALIALAATWTGDTRQPFIKNPDDHKPRNREDTEKPDEHFDFTKFKFYRPIEIFVYIYHESLGDKETKNITIDDDKLISFGPLMQEKDNENVPIKAKANCSFFNARTVDLSKYDKLNKYGCMLRVENWARNENGGELPNPSDIPHSINIHFTLPGGGKDLLIPMVFDPDTGNGTGNEP